MRPLHLAKNYFMVKSPIAAVSFENRKERFVPAAPGPYLVVYLNKYKEPVGEAVLVARTKLVVRNGKDYTYTYLRIKKPRWGDVRSALIYPLPPQQGEKEHERYLAEERSATYIYYLSKKQNGNIKTIEQAYQITMRSTVPREVDESEGNEEEYDEYEYDDWEDDWSNEEELKEDEFEFEQDPF